MFRCYCRKNTSSHSFVESARLVRQLKSCVTSSLCSIKARRVRGLARIIPGLLLRFMSHEQTLGGAIDEFYDADDADDDDDDDDDEDDVVDDERGG